jgi:short-subunit dehydrogenase
LKNEESALINTSSIYGIITTPNNTVYHASKFAVRGFTESLMKEMHDTPVQVHCVYPGHIGTNIVSNARFNEEGEGILGIDGKPAKDREGNLLTASQIGERFREGGMDPDHAAKIILKGVKKDKKRIFVGLDAKLMEIAQRIAPQHYLKIIPFIFFLTLPFYIKRIMRANKARKKLKR